MESIAPELQPSKTVLFGITALVSIVPAVLVQPSRIVLFGITVTAYIVIICLHRQSPTALLKTIRMRVYTVPMPDRPKSSTT